jgi:predicted transposase YdaD
MQAEVADDQEMQGLEGVLAVFGAKIFGAATIKAIYGRLQMSNSINDLILSSPLFQEAVAEVTAKAEEKGLEKGQAEGLGKGQVLALRRSLRRILEKRFGQLDPALVGAIDTADAVTLDAVVVDAVTEPLEMIRARLVPPAADTPPPQP